MGSRVGWWDENSQCCVHKAQKCRIQCEKEALDFQKIKQGSFRIGSILLKMF